jgi:hypothetical protein
MSQTDYPGERRAVLYVRSDLPAPSEKRRTAVETQLQELTCKGVLDESETRAWKKRVPVESGGPCRERDLYNEFADWARDAGVCLAPFFDTRRCYSTETGDRQKELVLPALCLTVYEDGELVQVAPFASGGRTESVEDCLDRLVGTDSLPQSDTPAVSTAN